MKGPGGPVAALVELNNVGLLGLESMREGRFPSYLEMVGFLLGISGGFSFLHPEKFRAVEKRMVSIKDNLSHSSWAPS